MGKDSTEHGAGSSAVIAASESAADKWKPERHAFGAHAILSSSEKMLCRVLDAMIGDRDSAPLDWSEVARRCEAPAPTVWGWRKAVEYWGIFAINWACGPNGGRSRKDCRMYTTRIPVECWRQIPPPCSGLTIAEPPDRQRRLIDEFDEHAESPEEVAEVARPSRDPRATLARPSRDLPPAAVVVGPIRVSSQGVPAEDQATIAFIADLNRLRAERGLPLEQGIPPVKEVKEDLSLQSTLSKKSSSSATPDPGSGGAAKDSCAALGAARPIGECVVGAVERTIARLDSRVTQAAIVERMKREIHAVIPELADWARDRLAEKVGYEGLDEAEVYKWFLKYRRYRDHSDPTKRIDPKKRGGYFGRIIEEKLPKLGFEWRKAGDYERTNPAAAPDGEHPLRE